MHVTMNLEGAASVREMLKHEKMRIRDKIMKEIYTAGIKVQTEARKRLKQTKAWDTGHAATSILVERSPDGATVEVGPTAPYAPYIEFGAKPHFPPPDALEDWARRHGFDSAWPICRAIAKRGIKANPFLFPAYISEERQLFSRLHKIVPK